MQDALVVGFSIVLDCSGLLSLEGLPVPWLLETLKMLDTIKTIWSGGAARCWKIVVYNPTSSGLLLYQRLSSLLALTNGTSPTYKRQHGQSLRIDQNLLFPPQGREH
jgi:hypothetical protein